VGHIAIMDINEKRKSLAPAGSRITITFSRNIVHFSKVQGMFQITVQCPSGSCSLHDNK
jgi:hypothetical protein